MEVYWVSNSIPGIGTPKTLRNRSSRLSMPSSSKRPGFSEASTPPLHSQGSSFQVPQPTKVAASPYSQLSMFSLPSIPASKPGALVVIAAVC